MKSPSYSGESGVGNKSFPVQFLHVLELWLLRFIPSCEHGLSESVRVCCTECVWCHLAPCVKEIKHFLLKSNFFPGLFYWVFVTIATNQTLLLGVPERDPTPAHACVSLCLFASLKKSFKVLIRHLLQWSV